MDHNKPNLKQRRKYLRNHLTPAEATLWKFLKSKQVNNLKFRRQHSVDHYILDFYCPELKLAIELDGDFHFYNQESDIKRDQYLRNLGITILRFENRMVFEHLDVIIREIKEVYNRTL